MMKSIGVASVCLLIAVGVVQPGAGAQTRALAPAGVSSQPSGDRFVCPMHPHVVADRPGTCPTCRMALVNPAVSDLTPYDVVVATTPSEIQAGRPFRLSLTVRHPSTGEVVSTYEVVHGMWFHLFIVSRDMTVFQHVHPELQPDQTWAIEVVLPQPGHYVLLSDFVPVGGVPQFVSRAIATAAASGSASAAGLELSASMQASSGDITATLSLSPQRLVAGTPASMTYTLTDAASGQPITDLQPYLGAFGHTLVAREGLSQYVHAHPDDNDARLLMRNPRGGPDVTFDTLFAEAGRYRAWTQFQRNGEVHTVSFTFDVSASETWNHAAAARYLDARMELWWQRAKTLKTAASEVKCLSCHTALPYMLARPALRRALGVTTPTDHEMRIVSTARARVAYRGEDQPYYDDTEDKKIESRGVEAVLNALVLASDEISSSAPSADTRAAMARLWQVQRADGAWDWLNFGLEPFEAPDAIYYGASLAAIAAGSEGGRRASVDAAGRTGIEKLRTYLQSQYPSQRLFNRVWALLASTRFDGILTPATRAALLADLRATQRADGGWSLTDLGPWRWTHPAAPFAPPGAIDAPLLAESDGYATGLVVYAMRQAGVSRDYEVVRKGQQWLRAHLTTERADVPEWAPWRAHSLNHDREHGGARGETWRRLFMSDLATAFAALALL